MQHILIALAQINPVVGNIQYNADKIVKAAQDAAEHGAALVVFPELSLSGYPPEDLILKDHFLKDCRACAEALVDRLPRDIVAVVGSPWREDDKAYNAALVYSEGEMVSRGDRIGIIRFGSRVDLFIPSGWEVTCREGDKVKVGETVLARIPSESET